MKRIILACFAFAVAAPAWAATPSCIDPRDPYKARQLNQHDIWVQNTLGTRKPPIRLETTCTHLDPAIGFGLSAELKCLSRGDIVVTTLGARHQTCTVTRVMPYAPQDGDIKQDMPN